MTTILSIIAIAVIALIGLGVVVTRAINGLEQDREQPDLANYFYAPEVEALERCDPLTYEELQARNKRLEDDREKFAHQISRDSIDMFLEYRDVHGYDEEAAKAKACVEMWEGVRAERELFESGELRQEPEWFRRAG